MKIIKENDIISIDTGDEYFEIENGIATKCFSKDIDLNSSFDIVKIINYLKNHYGVEINV